MGGVQDYLLKADKIRTLYTSEETRMGHLTGESFSASHDL